MPRAVGVQALADLADVELVGEPDPAEVAERLDAQLPHGMSVVGIEPAEGRTAAARVEATAYDVEVEDDVDWPRALAAFADGRELRGGANRPRQGRSPDRRPRVLLEHRAEPGRLRMRASDDRSGHRPPGGELHRRLQALIGRTANHQPAGTDAHHACATSR